MPVRRVGGERLQQRQVRAQAGCRRAIAVSGSGIPTWTCSAAVGVRATQAAHLVADRLVALRRDVHDVAERRVGMQPAADERRARLAQLRRAAPASVSTPSGALRTTGVEHSISAS